MSENFESGALLGHVYTLEDGSHVRLRLTRGSDARAIGELLGRDHPRAAELDIARLVHFDPRRRCVLCATGLVGSTEKLLGLGAIALDDGPEAEPDLLVLAPEASQELAQLMTRTLVGFASIPRAA